VLDRRAGAVAGLRIAGPKFGEGTMQHFLGEALGERLQHGIHVLAARQQLAGAGDLQRPPFVGLGIEFWIRGTTPPTGLRWSSQCMKLCTPASMMASAWATAA